MGYMNYEERLEVAKRLYELSNAEQKTALECIFPELCESEDEKVRKTLIRVLNENVGNGIEKYGAKLEEALAWLEKQGEQKPAWSAEDQNALEDVREAVVNYWGGDTQDILLYWLKSLKERVQPKNHWKPSDDDINLLKEVEQALLGKDCHNRLVDFMWKLKKLKE